MTKRGAPKIAGGGLRQFTGIVLKTVESKGTTTYNEVADEIIVDYCALHNDSEVSMDEFIDRNIRRRIYDVINVLVSLDIIDKHDKEIRWKGLPSVNSKIMEDFEAIRVNVINIIEKKVLYLCDMEDQIADLQKLISRNHQMLESGTFPSEGIHLPFIIARTHAHATVKIEISEDMRLVYANFNSTPFTLHSDAYILKLMRCYQKQGN